MKKLITEWREYINEDIYGNRAIVYHGTDSLKDVEQILTEGYSLEKNMAAMYGKGIYTVYELEGTNTGSGHYGPMVIKFVVDMSGKHLILDYDQAKKVYGDGYTLEDQLRQFGLLDNEVLLTEDVENILGSGSLYIRELESGFVEKTKRQIFCEVVDVGRIKIDKIPPQFDINLNKLELQEDPVENIWVHYRVYDENDKPFKKGGAIDKISRYKPFLTWRIQREKMKEVEANIVTIPDVPVKNKSIKDILEFSDELKSAQGKRTSIIAKKIHKLLSTSKNRMDHYLDSITFTGANDGPVMVIYNPKKSKMLSWKKIENKDALSVGDRVKFKDFAASYWADKMIKQLDNSVEKFYKILDAVGIKRDSKEILKYMDNPEEDLHKVFTKYLKSLRGEVIKSKPQWKSNHVKWDDEGTGHFFKKDLVLVSSKYGSEWIKDVNGKKILDYIQNLKKQKKPNLPQ